MAGLDGKSVTLKSDTKNRHVFAVIFEEKRDHIKKYNFSQSIRNGVNFKNVQKIFLITYKYHFLLIYKSVKKTAKETPF